MEDAKKEKAVDRIMKCFALAHGAGASEREIDLALSRARSLMAEYDLEMSDLESFGQREEEISKDKIPMWTNLKNQPFSWMIQLAEGIGKCFGCKVLFYQDSRELLFIGTSTHIEVCKELYARVRNQMYEIATIEARKSNQHVLAFRPNFLLGCVARVIERLRELHVKDQEDRPTYGALVLKRDALVVAKMQEWFPNTKPTTVSGVNWNWHAAAYQAGRKAGDRIQLEEQKQIDATRQITA